MFSNHSLIVRFRQYLGARAHGLLADTISAFSWKE